MAEHNRHTGCCGNHEHSEACGCSHHHEHSEDCGCGCGHHHDHEETCGCGCGHDHDHEPEKGEGVILLLGAALFVLGILASFLGWKPAALGLQVAAYLLLGLPVLKNAGQGLLKGRMLDENFLMGIATIGAFCIGEVPEAVGVMLFYRVGEYFEHRATSASRKHIMEAVDLRPETVTLADGTVIPAGEAKVGDVLTIRPGDRIPLDGSVLQGESRIDTAPVTGESVPVAVKPGSALVSGCVNTTGLLTMVVAKPLERSMVTRILESVEQAAASKPKMDRFLTRFSRIYTPLVVGIAALTAVVPSLITGDWNYWVYTALSFLVMSCPCALVISVPLAFFSGIGMGSRQGILFKGGAAIEALAGVKVAAMDKTGTLTRGEFAVLEGDAEVLRLCAVCEQGSNHPIAQSILAAVPGPLPSCQEVKEMAGLGICARAEGRELLCGSRELLQKQGITVPPAQGTAVYLAVDGEYRGTVLLGDRLKDDAIQAVSQLKRLGIQPAMVTGDQEEAASAAARAAGIDRVFARLLPDGKLKVLQQLRQSHGPVLFVGDGINDAPVLAGADVGAAMGSGADAAIEAADVVYMTSRAGAIPQSVRLARCTRNIAWQNVVFAIGIKAIVMVLGLLGFANMWLAVFADSGVAMLCVLNSIRLLAKK